MTALQGFTRTSIAAFATDYDTAIQLAKCELASASYHVPAVICMHLATDYFHCANNVLAHRADVHAALFLNVALSESCSRASPRAPLCSDGRHTATCVRCTFTRITLPPHQPGSSAPAHQPSPLRNAGYQLRRGGEEAELHPTQHACGECTQLA